MTNPKPLNASLFINPSAIKGIVSPNKRKCSQTESEKTLLAKYAHTQGFFWFIQELYKPPV